MTSQRMKKVESLILREVSDILLNEIKDPRVDGVTPTEARVSADLQNATIYYQCKAVGEELEVKAAGLESARRKVKTMVGKRVKLKFLPDIKFRYDSSLEHAERIEELLREALPRSDEDNGGVT